MGSIIGMKKKISRWREGLLRIKKIKWGQSLSARAGDDK